MPQIVVDHSHSEDQYSDDEGKGNQQAMSHKSVVLDCGVSSNEFAGMGAELFAFSGRVAEWDTSQVNVTIGISPDQVEEWSEAAASIVTESSALWAASVRVADQQLSNQSWDLEECIQEWSSNDAAPVPCDESPVRRVARSLTSPVPVNSIAWDAEVERISQKLETPNELNDVEDAPEPSTWEIEWSDSTPWLWSKGEVLECY